MKKSHTHTHTNRIKSLHLIPYLDGRRDTHCSANTTDMTIVSWVIYALSGDSQNMMPTVLYPFHIWKWQPTINVCWLKTSPNSNPIHINSNKNYHFNCAKSPNEKTNRFRIVRYFRLHMCYGPYFWYSSVTFFRGWKRNEQKELYLCLRNIPWNDL